MGIQDGDDPIDGIVCAAVGVGFQDVETAGGIADDDFVGQPQWAGDVEPPAQQ